VCHSKQISCIVKMSKSVSLFCVLLVTTLILINYSDGMVMTSNGQGQNLETLMKGLNNNFKLSIFYNLQYFPFILQRKILYAFGAFGLFVGIAHCLAVTLINQPVTKNEDLSLWGSSKGQELEIQNMNFRRILSLMMTIDLSSALDNRFW